MSSHSYIPNPKNKNIYRKSTREQLGIPENSILIFFVGSGFERKGLKFLLQSTEFLEDQNWRLLLMGKGNFEKYLHFAPYNKRNHIIAKKPDPAI